MKQHVHGCLAFALALAVGSAQADRGRLRSPMNPDYTSECASCHMAYPPGLLSAPAWQRLMGGLPSHFGTDASLEPATQAALTAWLVAHAGSTRGVEAAPPQDRITRSAWFERKHRRIAASVWQRTSIKSASNCAACHRDAAAGDFEDDAVVVPR
jgi:hypothetical protein